MAQNLHLPLIALHQIFATFSNALTAIAFFHAHMLLSFLGTLVLVLWDSNYTCTCCCTRIWHPDCTHLPTFFWIWEFPGLEISASSQTATTSLVAWQGKSLKQEQSPLAGMLWARGFFWRHVSRCTPVPRPLSSFCALRIGHVGFRSRQGHGAELQVCGKQGRADQEAQAQYSVLRRSEKHWFSGGTLCIAVTVLFI